MRAPTLPALLLRRVGGRRSRVSAAALVLVAAVATGLTVPPSGADAQETATPAGSTLVTLPQDGTPLGRVDRLYRLTVPAAPARGPRPLVLVLHGRHQHVDSLRSVSGIEALGEREGFVTAFPAGWAGAWNAGTCCNGGGPQMPDVDFLDQVVADVAARTPVDRSRVHVVGYSNGGMMAYRYACERSAAVAGVGVVSGAMAASPDYADQGEQRCRPDVPVSVVAVHGEADRTVPYPGGPVAGTDGSVAPVRGGVDQSAVAAGCRTGGTSRVGASVRLDYTDCADGSAVRLVVLRGHGHGWTRDSRRYGYDTTAGVWGFLKPRRAASAP